MDLQKIAALVAEQVMGHIVKSDGSSLLYEFSDKHDDFILLRPYPTDIAAAWEVVEKICPNANGGSRPAGQFYVPEFSLTTHTNKVDGSIFWSCSFYHRFTDGITHHGTGDSAAEAICSAALKAKGIDISQLTAQSSQSND